MRLLLLALVPIATIAAASASNGVYATLPARDTAACARLCADDSLCMAWTFRGGNECDLKAVVPSAQDQSGASGVSYRAPGAMRAWTQISTQPAEEPVAETIVTEASAPAPTSEDDISAMLLGGPDGE